MAVLLVVILVIGYLVYANFLAKPSAPADVPEMATPGGGGVPTGGISLPGMGTTTPSPGTGSTGGAVPSSKLNADLLNDPRFADLVIFGEPVEVGEVGRENPFIPYEGYKEISETTE